MIVLGIVGSIASGKSTVARRLETLGAAWIDADTIARRMLDQPTVQSELKDHFGVGITGISGGIDRTKLARMVFGDDDSSRVALEYLESVVHPLVHQQITQTLKTNAKSGVEVSLLDVPLLFKSQWDRCCDEIWCIDATRSIREARAHDRGWKADELAKRESRQLPLAEKKRLSHLVIENNSTLSDFHQTIQQHWENLLKNPRPGRKPAPHCP